MWRSGGDESLIPTTTRHQFCLIFPKSDSHSPFFFLLSPLKFHLQPNSVTLLNADPFLRSFALPLSIPTELNLETSPFLLNPHPHPHPHHPDMVSPETTNWLFDYALMDDIPVSDANFSPPTTGFSWSMTPLNGSANVRFHFSLISIQFCSIFLFYPFTIIYCCWPHNRIVICVKVENSLEYAYMDF